MSQRSVFDVGPRLSVARELHEWLCARLPWHVMRALADIGPLHRVAYRIVSGGDA